MIAAWVALAAALSPFLPKLPGEAEDESETFLVRGSESAEVERLLEERFTVGREVATAIVYELPEPDGTFLSGAEERIVADAVALCESSEIPDLRAVFPPTAAPACDHRDQSLDIGPETPPSPISEDQRVALTIVLTGDDETTAVVRDVEAIRGIVAGAGARTTWSMSTSAARAGWRPTAPRPSRGSTRPCSRSPRR